MQEYLKFKDAIMALLKEHYKVYVNLGIIWNSLGLSRSMLKINTV